MSAAENADTGEPVRSLPARILIVDDDPFVASYIEDVLNKSGFTIAGIAASGPEALSLAEEAGATLALVDIRLAGDIDGVELACRLRRQHALPVIFLSGFLDGETVRRARTAEPVGFLAKPFMPSQVFNAIERALAAKQQDMAGQSG